MQVPCRPGNNEKLVSSVMMAKKWKKNYIHICGGHHYTVKVIPSL